MKGTNKQAKTVLDELEPGRASAKGTMDSDRLGEWLDHHAVPGVVRPEQPDVVRRLLRQAATVFGRVHQFVLGPASLVAIGTLFAYAPDFVPAGFFGPAEFSGVEPEAQLLLRQLHGHATALAAFMVNALFCVHGLILGSKALHYTVDGDPESGAETVIGVLLYGLLYLSLPYVLFVLSL